MTTDPFLELRIRDDATDPDPMFRASLRDRLAAALDDTQEPTMSYIPARLSTITPYLTCRDAHDAIGWYRAALGAEVVGEIHPMSDTDDRVGHAELRIGESTIFLSDEWPEGDVYSPATTGHSTTGFVLYVPDADLTFDHAVALGATSVRPVADQFHGSRAGWLRDPFGHRWNIATALPDAAAGPPPGRPFRAGDLFDEIGYYVLGRPDLDRAKAFYGSVFGWRFAEENTTPGGFRGAHVTSSKVPFGLTDDPGIRTWHPWFRVTDLRASLDRIRAAGGEVLEQQDSASGGNARCRDDQGVEFELYQPNPGY
jgi:PhnB protein